MKLCPHVFDGSADARRICAAGAPAVKLVGGYSSAGDYPAAIRWARVIPGNDDLWRQYTPDAFYSLIRPHVTHPANAAVTAWEDGLNEDSSRKTSGETPDLADIAARGVYEAQVAQLIRADGRAPVVGQFSVGTPSGTAEEQRAAWRAYAPALRAAYSYGGYVSLHAYGSVSGWTGPLDALVQVLGELRLDVPILISECGHEPAWRDWSSPAEVLADLIGYDAVLQRYPAVKAAAIFSYGNCPGKWDRYNMDDETITAGLVNYSQTVPPRPPTERPLFSFPGAGLRMALYDAPGGRVVRIPAADWTVDVFETRGAWWRVTTAPSNYWVRMSFA